MIAWFGPRWLGPRGYWQKRYSPSEADKALLFGIDIAHSALIDELWVNGYAVFTSVSWGARGLTRTSITLVPPGADRQLRWRLVAVLHWLIDWITPRPRLSDPNDAGGSEHD